MRCLVLILFCLISLAGGGTVSAARTADLRACGDCPATVQSGSAATIDCGMGQDKAHRCAHDACCGYQVIAISDVRDFALPSPPRTAAVASLTKDLTGSAWETILDPPRA